MTDTPAPPASDLPSSWDAEDGDALRTDKKSRRWWIIGAAAVVVLVVIGAFAVVAIDKKTERAWPAEISGRPAGLGAEKETAAKVTPSVAPGVYLWNGFDGWHLWVVNGDGLDGLSGTITSTEGPERATSSAPAAGNVTVDGKEITFDLDGSGKVAGVDFEPGFYAKKLTIELKTASGKVPANVVFLGSGRTSARSVPLVVDKKLVN